jgi:hypothetical protein
MALKNLPTPQEANSHLLGKEGFTQGLGEGETFHANMGKPCTVALACFSGRESRQQHNV